MKKLNFIILSLFLVFGLTACDTVDFDDINKNPNGATEISASGLMSSAIMDYATITGRDYLIRPTLNVQYQSQVTYTSEMRYSESKASWYAYYVGAMSSLDQVIKYNQDPDNQGATLNAQGYPANQIGVSMILKSVIAKRVTDTWGDIPYSEGFMGLENLAPAYDKQEDIYKSIIADVKAARDMMDSNEDGPIGDILYNGNIAQWKKFANSFLLQATLQLSKKYPSASDYPAVEFNNALNDVNGLIETPSDEAWFQYQDLTGFRNPWFANRTRDYFLSQEFTDALKGNAALNPTSNTTFDDRISVYAKNTSDDGVPYGYSNGSGSGKNQMSTANYWNADSSLPMLTASYTYLNRADAAEMGWTSEDVMEMLTNGIELSFETLDAHHGTAIAGNAATYAAARISDASSFSNAQVIAEEKWVSLYPSGFDAWAEWRRTEVPVLAPATDFLNSGVIPRRYNYPVEESSLNGSNYDIGVQALSPTTDNNSSKVWWDQ